MRLLCGNPLVSLWCSEPYRPAPEKGRGGNVMLSSCKATESHRCTKSYNPACAWKEEGRKEIRP